jgi:hypothetical protein
MRYNIILLAIASTAVAHLAIQQPPPFADSQSKSPLLPTGGDFPCQGSTLSGGTVTNMAAGSSQPLMFNLGGGANTAVHGGGSCQISLGYGTTEAELKNPSAWKVIHSFIGGCPTEALGNLDTSVACPGGNGQCVDQSFAFDIPAEVQNGNAILAWTWFNNVGNREMYMNCAPVSISGGTNQMDSLPELFAANIGNGCATTEDFNTDFPNPGAYVTKSTLNYPLKAPVGTCGSGSGSASVASTNTTAPAAAAPSAGVFAEGTAPAASGSAAPAAPASPTTLASAPAPAAATVAPAAAVAAPAPATGSGTCGTGSVACTASGFYCISTTQFGMCNFGCAIPQAVAAGTQCTGGSIAMAGKKLKVRHVQKRNFFNMWRL